MKQFRASQNAEVAVPTVCKQGSSSPNIDRIWRVWCYRNHAAAVSSASPAVSDTTRARSSAPHLDDHMGNVRRSCPNVWVTRQVGACELRYAVEAARPLRSCWTLGTNGTLWSL